MAFWKLCINSRRIKNENDISSRLTESPDVNIISLFWLFLAFEVNWRGDNGLIIGLVLLREGYWLVGPLHLLLEKESDSVNDSKTLMVLSSRKIIYLKNFISFTVWKSVSAASAVESPAESRNYFESVRPSWAFSTCPTENECENGHDTCDRKTQDCYDTFTSFRCECKRGYIKNAG